MLYPREMNTGVTEDQRDVFVRSEFAKIRQGRRSSEGIVSLTAYRVIGIP